LQYRVSDQTGTASAMVSSAGTEYNKVLPYGESLASSSIDQKFTTYDRESTSNLDYAMARFYTNRYGRFVSPDKSLAGVDLTDTQSWNLYTYVLNDPVNYEDPSGEDPCVNGINPISGNICVNVTGNYEPQYFPPGSCPDISQNGIPIGNTCDSPLRRIQAVDPPISGQDPGLQGLSIGLDLTASRIGGDLFGAALGGIGRMLGFGSKTARLGTLTHVGKDVWESSGGLRYSGLDRAELNRVQHVLQHTVADTAKPVHSVFGVTRGQVLGLVDEAWISPRRIPLTGDGGAFITPMGRTVGTMGENAVRIIIRGFNEVITAYPVRWP
jgi:RHS repeat-associated protein